MRWKEKTYEKPMPQRWFAWYPVTLTAYNVVCWWEWVWRKEITIDSERYYIYSDCEKGCSMEAIAQKAVDEWMKP